MRWSFGRPTTVRTRIVALALAPVLALMVLWSFAMVSVTGELRALVRVQGVYDDFGTPVDTAVGQIQIERRLAAAYLGADHGTAAALDLMEQQRRTDRAVTAMRTAIRDGDRGRLSARQRQVLDAVLRSFDGLDGLRERVLSRAISWDRAVTEYGALVEPGFDVQSALTALQAGQLAREAQVVIELVRVREFVSREDALVAGARAAGSLTDGQYDTLTATIEDRRVFERTYVPDLPADSRALFEEFQRGSLYRELTRGEDALLRAGARGAGRPSRPAPGAPPPTGPSSGTCSCARGRPSTPPNAGGPSPTGSWPRRRSSVYSDSPPWDCPCGSPCAAPGASRAAWRPSGTPPTSSPPASCPT